ncbi:MULTISPECIES: L,D-transpeptidase [Saccharothrix]|uniref:L,D-transpeptidase n=1 Tax=Saccharothrix TaxID=2071 RepID=UPI001F5179AE|nr:L,D-transpeptidase [Saccharothrix sp. CB00851]
MAIALLATACGTSEASGPAASTPSPASSTSTPSSAAPTSEPSVPAPTPAPTPEPAPPTETTKTPDPQPAPPPPPVTVPGTPCDITSGACVRLSTNESWLISGGRISYGPVPTTSGMPGYETPVGYFSVLWKVRDDWSIPYNGPMPFSTYFVGNGIAFHEGSLTEKSHGCIHLSREAAAKYFETLQVGDQVQVAP